MNKEYWGRGEAVKRLSSFMKDVLKNLKLKKIYWLTNYPKHSERHGFKRARSVLMEYTEEEDGKDTEGRLFSQRECPNVNPRAKELATANS